MLTLRPFSPSDPLRIAPREDFRIEHEAAGSPLFGPERVQGLCWTLTDGDRKWAKPLACGGLEPQGHGRFAGWLYAADLSPRGWAMVKRAFRRMVAESGARRVEVTVRREKVLPEAGVSLFTKATAYAELDLGLTWEGRLRAWGPDGVDYDLYAGVF